jgi:hypothetical protein
MLRRFAFAIEKSRQSERKNLCAAQQAHMD